MMLRGSAGLFVFSRFTSFAFCHLFNRCWGMATFTTAHLCVGLSASSHSPHPLWKNRGEVTT